jgi:hypothetical protein
VASEFPSLPGKQTEVEVRASFGEFFWTVLVGCAGVSWAEASVFMHL